jgi:hypothetical protein
MKSMKGFEVSTRLEPAGWDNRNRRWDMRRDLANKINSGGYRILGSNYHRQVFQAIPHALWLAS